MKVRADDGTLVALTKHAKVRMAERGITMDMVMHTINHGRLVVSAGGKPQWVAAIDEGASRIHLALDVQGSTVVVPTVWARGRLDNGVK